MDSRSKKLAHTALQSLSLKFAETLYRKKMNKVSAKPNFIEIQDLLERHEYSIQYALEITAEAETLTASKKQEIKNLLEQLFFYYREINLKKRDIPGPAIGIDLGTTNCCVAVYQSPNNDHPSGPVGLSPGSPASAGHIRIIHNDMGFDKTPSQVAFPTDQDQPIYGETAKMLAYQNPQNTIYSVKRMIGRKFEHVRQQNQMTFWPFTIIKNTNNGEIKVQIYDKNKLPRNAYAPEEISSLLIKYLKESAEDALGMPVLSAVVAVPAYFNAYQRELTRVACQQAGLNVLQLINEPTAAAVAYSVHKRGSHQQGEKSNSVKSPRNCLIFDLGGGTFDVAVLTIKNDQIFIKAIGGDAQLGGEDFDNNMVSYCVREFKREHGINLTEGKSSCDTLEKFKSSKSLRRLKMECEKQKKCLSKVRRTAVSVEAIHDNLDLTVEFTVAKLEELNMELFERCITIVEDVLQKSMLKKEDIHDIILAGGSTRIPKIQQMISDFFPAAKLNREINPDDAIATGAALLAFYAENPEVPNILIREPEYLQVDIPEDNNNNRSSNDVDDIHLVDDNSSDLPSEIMDSKKPAEFTSQIGQRYSFHSKTDDTLNFGFDTRLSGAEDSPPSTLNPLNQSTTQHSTDHNGQNLKMPLNQSNQTEGRTTQQTMDELSVTVLLRQDTSNIMNEMQIKSEMHGYLERKSYQPGISTFELIYVALHDKILYFFKTEEDFWANDAGAKTVALRKSSFEIKDYRGSKRSFLLNVSDGSKFLFLVENESRLKDWVRHLERNTAARIQSPIEDLEDDFIPRDHSHSRDQRQPKTLEDVLKSTDEVDKEKGNEIPKNKLQMDQIDEDSDSDQLNTMQEKKFSGKMQIHGFLQKKNLLIESKVIRLSKLETFYVSLQGKYLYLFSTKEEFMANADVEDDLKIYIHKCSCEIRDYLGQPSFILKVQNGSEYLFVAEDSTLVDSWVRKIETNSAVRLANHFITQRPTKVAEFIRALQKRLVTN